MKDLKIILLFQFFSVFLYAQDNVVSGTVKDSNGEVLPGATVLVKGTNFGTVTDFDGNFSIKVKNKKNAVLLFSYVGYGDAEVVVGDKAFINVSLEGMQQLDEVVVTALGIKREKKLLTYASQTVDTDDFSETRTTNFLNNLSGKVAGVQITSSGSPVGSNRVVIRGATSITEDNQPLYYH